MCNAQILYIYIYIFDVILKLNSDLKQDSLNDSSRSKGNQIYHVAIPSSRKANPKQGFYSMLHQFWKSISSG